MSNTIKGKTSPYLGKTDSELVKNKKSESHKGLNSGAKEKNGQRQEE